MQSAAHFDGTNAAYSGSVYTGSVGFEPGSLKLPTTYEMDCYSGYMGLQYPAWRDPQACREPPPAYPENNFLHPGSGYYKTATPPARHDYGLPGGQDSFLMKPADPVDVYPADQQLTQQHVLPQHHHVTYGGQDISKLTHEVYANKLSTNDLYQNKLNNNDSYGAVKTEVPKLEPSQPEYDIPALSSASQSSIPSSSSLSSPPSSSSIIQQPELINQSLPPATSSACEAPQPQETENKSGSEVSPGDSSKEENKDAPGGKDDKPTMSYIALIAKAILESEQRRLNLGAIYGWIEKHFPFYKNKGQGWRNSVRHNLSLNDCFIKAGRCEDGKGNYWAIHPANLQDFIRGDFRQRRRSRRRGRKKECELNMYHMTNGYLPPTAPSTLTPAAMTFNPTALSSIYSPYTEAERRCVPAASTKTMTDLDTIRSTIMRRMSTPGKERTGSI